MNIEIQTDRKSNINDPNLNSTAVDDLISLNISKTIAKLPRKTKV